jgi:hypothetical protein
MICRMPFGRSAATLWLTFALLLAVRVADAAAVIVNVSTATQLANAVATANSAGGNYTIVLADGTYTVPNTLHITAPNVTITSASGVRENVIVQGDAMSANAAIGDVILASASYFTVSNLTLQHSGWHLLQVAGEVNADNAVIHNVVFRDAYQQLLKVSFDPSTPTVTGDNGVIEDSLFEYTAGIGPEYYIGGIDVHGGQNWIVRGNTFRSIISPDTSVAEFAIHFWDGSGNALVEKNLIVNCDRGIGFGLANEGNTAGIIRNNMIYHAANDGQFEDVSIYLEDSPNSQVYNNTILAEHTYPNAIEYRFAPTSGLLIVNNLTNKAITARDGATATTGSNVVTAVDSWFVNPSQGDLHLAAKIAGVVDAGQAVAGLVDDFDGTPRPQGSGFDIGAHEWTGSGTGSTGTATRPDPPTNVSVQ